MTTVTAPFTRYNCFSQDISRGKHNFQAGSSMVFKAMLTNTAPAPTDTLYSGISANELAAGSGYTTGGFALTPSDSLVAVTQTVNSVSVTTYANKLFLSNATFTATGAVGSYRYVVVYNATNGALIGSIDYGSANTMASGDTFVIGFDQTNGFDQIGAPTGS